jgi:hypothetical protein
MSLWVFLFDQISRFVDCVTYLTHSPLQCYKRYCHVMDWWYSAWLHFTVHCYTHIHQCPQSRLHCRCLVAASNDGRFPSSEFPNGPRPHLPAFHSNSSQLNRSSSLTNSLTHRLTNRLKSQIRFLPFLLSHLRLPSPELDSIPILVACDPRYISSRRTPRKTPIVKVHVYSSVA